MCNFELDKDEVGRRFAIDFDGYFAQPLTQLAGAGGGSHGGSPAQLVVHEGRTLRITDAGRLFVRNVCMAFDRYLDVRQSTGKPAYSRTV